MIEVPVFPLPETVLFPKVSVSLHLFEPRYRQLGDDATAGDGDLIMALLRPGWESDYDGTPPMYETATLGRIRQHERLEDGRYDLVLQGVERVRMLPRPGSSELAPGRLYRVRAYEPAPERHPAPSHEVDDLAEGLRARWKELLTLSALPADVPGNDVSFEVLVNHIANMIDVPPPSKQKLLEEDELIERGARLSAHLDNQLQFWRQLSRYRRLKPDDPSVN